MRSKPLGLNNVATTNFGNYSVVVTNVSGSVTSSYAVLTVSTNLPATINAQPLDQTTTTGGSASFNVVPGGTAPFTFQWQVNGADIAGATNATLALSNLSTNDAGTYDVVVANTCGIVVSSTALLMVNDPPAITSQPTNLTVSVGGSAGFAVTATGTPPLSYISLRAWQEIISLHRL